MKKRYINVGWILFYLYIMLLAYFLFFSEEFGRNIKSEEYRYNLEFFKEIKRYIHYRQRVGFINFIINIFGNVIAFLPFGFMLPLLSVKCRKFLYVTFLSLIFSLSIELVQLALKVGIFDVDDVLMNTAGGMLGGLIFFICYGILTLIKRYQAKKKISRGR